MKKLDMEKFLSELNYNRHCFDNFIKLWI